MSKYNFEKRYGEFEETIKLDNINKQVREERGHGNRGGNGGGNNRRRRKKRKRSNGIIGPAIIIGVIAAILIFFAVFIFAGGNLPVGSNRPTDLTDDQAAGKEGFYALINSKNSNGKVGFYDFEHDVIYNMPISNDTVVTDSNGSKLKNSVVEVGHVVKAYIDFDSKKVVSINYTSDAWERDNILGSAVTVDNDTIVVGEMVYNYDADNILVVFEDSVAKLSDISASDVLCVRGFENNVLSVRIKESGGYITVIGWDEIENGTISIDGESTVKLDKEKIKISSGKHTLIIKGDNIEEYIADVYVTPGGEVGIDLGDMVNMGTIVFTSNVADYDLYINGSLYEGGNECELPYGDYTLSAVKDGYNTWFKEVKLENDRLDVAINFEKTATTGRITIYSQPTAAEIYIEEEYVGRAPVMLEKPYGEYLLRASLEGYPDFIDIITVSGADNSVTAKLADEE